MRPEVTTRSISGRPVGGIVIGKEGEGGDVVGAVAGLALLWMMRDTSVE